MGELGASIWLELARVSAVIILLNEPEGILNYYFLWESREPESG